MKKVIFGSFLGVFVLLALWGSGFAGVFAGFDVQGHWLANGIDRVLVVAQSNTILILGVSFTFLGTLGGKRLIRRD